MYQSVLQRCRDGIDAYVNELLDTFLFCKIEETALWDADGRMFVCYDPLEYALSCEDLFRAIREEERELEQGRETSELLEEHSRLSRCFVPAQGDGKAGFTVQENPEHIEKLRWDSFFLYFTTDPTFSPEELLDYERTKQAEEVLFAQGRSLSGCGRIPGSCREILEGKVFVTFLAAILQSVMLHATQKLRRQTGWSVRRIYARPVRFRIRVTAGGTQLAGPVPGELKTILEAMSGYDLKIVPPAP